VTLAYSCYVILFACMVLQHFTYDTAKKFLTPSADEQPKVPIPMPLVAGALAGVASTLCTYPVELIKTRITIEVKTTRSNSSDQITV
jgi:hypothetical protein